MKIPLELRLAIRDFRGGIGGYKIFIASVILGVGSIAGVGSLSESILGGIAADGQKILGGDISIRVNHRPVTKIQLNWLSKHAEISRVSSMRSMARHKKRGLSTLVNFKAIDARYPLFGKLKLTPNTEVGRILSYHNGAWGAAIDQRIAEKLKLKLHDFVSIGNTQFRVRAFVLSKPDQNFSLRALTQGPPFIVSDKSLSATGLVMPGTQIYYEYRLKLPPKINLENFKNRLSKAFPSAGWRVRDRKTAAPSTERFINRITQFITLVGLTALFIGGLGAGNSVHAHLAKKTNIIATLKCVGAKKKTGFCDLVIGNCRGSHYWNFDRHDNWGYSSCNTRHHTRRIFPSPNENHNLSKTACPCRDIRFISRCGFFVMAARTSKRHYSGKSF